jgi:hypothetical protein
VVAIVILDNDSEVLAIAAVIPFSHRPVRAREVYRASQEVFIRDCVRELWAMAYSIAAEVDA